MKVTLTEDSRMNLLEIRFKGTVNWNLPENKRIYRKLKVARFEYWQAPVSAWVGKDTPDHREMFKEIESILNPLEKAA